VGGLRFRLERSGYVGEWLLKEGGGALVMPCRIELFIMSPCLWSLVNASSPI
jgi:hypothetical protein